MKTLLKPTPSELEILQILWNVKSATVKFIYDKINTTKQVGYTTILKQMQIMTEKGMLKREEKGRSHIYFPLIKKKDTQNLLLDKFLNKTFEGFPDHVIA